MSKVLPEPRQRLLDAGLRHFADRGYAGTSVLDITAEARVTKPTLYYYFESKEGLFQALVDQAMDERLSLMRAAAPPEKDTVSQLVDIIVAVTDFAARRPDLLRLCFSIAFAAPGEIPSTFKKHHKMLESYQFVREIVEMGRRRQVLNSSFTTDELTQSYFHLVQHSTVITVFESKMRRSHLPLPLPSRMEPRRMVELFLIGAAGQGVPLLGSSTGGHSVTLAKVLALMVGLGLCLSSVQGQTTNASATLPATNYPAADTVTPPAMDDTTPSNAPPTATIPDPSPDLADMREVPAVVTGESSRGRARFADCRQCA